MSVKEVELSLEGYRYYARWIDCEKGAHEPILFLSGAFQNMDTWHKFVRFFREVLCYWGTFLESASLMCFLKITD
jgi:hypothetical protein